ncbi:hypothetical protein B0H13DRAFT_1886917 [Mycena leptocephala]|nr:hypothetical protein B0H13DRAFT_1886917 [Mycena leptocephala]
MSSDLTRDAQHQVVSRCQKIVNRRSQSTASNCNLQLEAQSSCFDPDGGREALNSRKQAGGARRMHRSLGFCGEAKLCSRRSAAFSSCGNMCDGGRVSIIPSSEHMVSPSTGAWGYICGAPTLTYSPQYPSAKYSLAMVPNAAKQGGATHWRIQVRRATSHT